MSKLDDPRHLRQIGDLPEPLTRALREQAALGPTAEQSARLAAALGVSMPPASSGPASGAPPAATPAPAASGGASALGPLAWGAITVGAVTLIALGAQMGGNGLGGSERGGNEAPASGAPIAVAPVPPPSIAAPMPETTSVETATPAVTPLAEVPEVPEASRRGRPSRRPTSEVTAPEPEPAPVTVAPVATPEPPVEDDAAELRAENALVQRAEAALAHDPATALRIADEHDARFPHGTLGEECEVIAIDALLRMHRRADAETRAHAFTASHAGSVHSRRIERLLARP